MKKIFKIILILFTITICSGCVKIDGNTRIKNNKSMSFDISILYDKTIVGKDYISQDDIDNYKKLGYKVKEYKEDNYEGIELNWKVSNVDKVSTTENVSFLMSSIKTKVPEKVFKVKKNWFYNIYTANFIFDSTDINVVNDEIESDVVRYLCDDGSVIEVSSYDEVRVDCHRAYDFEIENALSDNPLSLEELDKKINKNNELKYTVKLSRSALSNNASDSKNDNKILTWNLKDTGITNINYKFKLYNHLNITITIICILLFVVAFMFVLKKIIDFVNKKKTKKRK